MLEWRELRHEAAARAADPSSRAHHPTPAEVREAAQRKLEAESNAAREQREQKRRERTEEEARKYKIAKGHKLGSDAESRCAQHPMQLQLTGFSARLHALKAILEGINLSRTDLLLP